MSPEGFANFMGILGILGHEKKKKQLVNVFQSSNQSYCVYLSVIAIVANDPELLTALLGARAGAGGGAPAGNFVTL